MTTKGLGHRERSRLLLQRPHLQPETGKRQEASSLSEIYVRNHWHDVLLKNGFIIHPFDFKNRPIFRLIGISYTQAISPRIPCDTLCGLHITLNINATITWICQSLKRKSGIFIIRNQTDRFAADLLKLPHVPWVFDFVFGSLFHVAPRGQDTGWQSCLLCV